MSTRYPVKDQYGKKIIQKEVPNKKENNVSFGVDKKEYVQQNGLVGRPKTKLKYKKRKKTC